MAARAAELKRFALTMGLAMLAVVGILALQPGSTDLAAILEIRPQLDLEPLWRAPVLIQVHVVTVFYALLVGPVQFLLPKGTPVHRMVGWTWVLAMFTTAVTSLGIREVNDGAFSPIHLFSVWTLISLPLAIWFARTGKIASHRSAMIGLYAGLVIAGLLAIAPGRLIWDMFFG